MPNPMLVRAARPGDSVRIAGLHCRQIPWGLLTQCGARFVAAFYSDLVDSPWGFAFVAAASDGALAGFASGVTEWRRFSGSFLRRHPWLAAGALAESFRRGRWRRMLETRGYMASSHLPPAELVSIAVDPRFRGHGVGAALVQRVTGEFGVRGVTSVRVTTASANVFARRLYEKQGFRLHAEVEIHCGERASIYTTTVRAAPPEGGLPASPPRSLYP